MNLALSVLAAVIWGTLIFLYVRRVRERRAFDRISITPEALHDLIVARHNIAILDVRQPLDLLADSEIIEGAIRLSPEDPAGKPANVPMDKDLVVYCTCPSDKTSRAIAMRAQRAAPEVDFKRVRFLKGGLAAWKARGYPVIPYDKSFHLDTGT